MNIRNPERSKSEGRKAGNYVKEDNYLYEHFPTCKYRLANCAKGDMWNDVEDVRWKMAEEEELAMFKQQTNDSLRSGGTGGIPAKESGKEGT